MKLSKKFENENEIEQALESLKNIQKGEIIGQYGYQLFKMNWDINQERRGIGNFITHANHIAITVSDVGTSSYFYSNILGLQQVERPDFDRHGAWFTCGNLELHLINGDPVVPQGNDLLVGHICLEICNPDKLLKRLQQFKPKIDFQMNVSVPTGDLKQIVKQFFLRDPDGYYIELGNTEVLTKFCFGSQVHKINSKTRIKKIALQAKKRLHDKNRTYKNLRQNDELVVNELYAQNLITRLTICGDIIQSENEQSVRQLLKKYSNYVPDVILEITIKAETQGQIIVPPTYYDYGDIQKTHEAQFIIVERKQTGILQKQFHNHGDAKQQLQEFMLQDKKQLRVLETIIQNAADKHKNNDQYQRSVNEIKNQALEQRQKQKQLLEEFDEILKNINFTE